MTEKCIIESKDDLFGRPTIGDLFPDFNPPTHNTQTKEEENGDKEAK